MRAVAERGSFGLLALAEPDFLRCIKHHFDASEGHAFHGFMGTVAKRLFAAQSATAPGIHFTRFHLDTGGFGDSDAGESFIGYRFHQFLFTGYKFIEVEMALLVQLFDFFFQYCFINVFHPFLFNQVKGFFCQQPEMPVGDMCFL